MNHNDMWAQNNIPTSGYRTLLWSPGYRRWPRWGMMVCAIVLTACAGSSPVSEPPANAVRSSEIQTTIGNASDPHLQAAAAFNARDYQQVLTLMEPLALGGDPRAQYILGYLYFNGFGVNKNQQVARQWIEQAANRGNQNALKALQMLESAPAQPRAQTRQRDSVSSNPESSTSGRWITESTVRPVQEPAISAMRERPERVQEQAVNTQQLFSPTTKPPTDNEEPSAVSEEPSAVSKEPSANNEEPSAVIAEPPPPSAPWDKQTETTITPSASQKANTRTAMVEHNTDWILAQPLENYTIQLLAGADKQAILGFIRRQDIGNQAAYFVFEGNELPLYAVIYGSFAGYSEAQHALNNLPAGVRTKSAWIRDFASIQKILITEVQ